MKWFILLLVGVLSCNICYGGDWDARIAEKYQPQFECNVPSLEKDVGDHIDKNRPEGVPKGESVLWEMFSGAFLTEKPKTENTRYRAYKAYLQNCNNFEEFYGVGGYTIPEELQSAGFISDPNSPFERDFNTGTDLLFFIIAREMDTQGLEKLLNTGVEIDFIFTVDYQMPPSHTEKFHTLLHYSVTEFVGLTSGALKKFQMTEAQAEKRKQTLLHFIEYLLEKGADANLENQKGETVFDIAKKGSHEELTQLLNS